MRAFLYVLGYSDLPFDVLLPVQTPVPTPVRTPVLIPVPTLVPTPVLTPVPTPSESPITNTTPVISPIPFIPTPDNTTIDPTPNPIIYPIPIPNSDIPAPAPPTCSDKSSVYPFCSNSQFDVNSPTNVTGTYTISGSSVNIFAEISTDNLFVNSTQLTFNLGSSSSPKIVVSGCATFINSTIIVNSAASSSSEIPIFRSNSECFFNTSSTTLLYNIPSGCSGNYDNSQVGFLYFNFDCSRYNFPIIGAIAGGIIGTLIIIFCIAAFTVTKIRRKVFPFLERRIQKEDSYHSF